MTCRVCAEASCFIHCVWCGADCDPPFPKHAPACPQSTGVYPAGHGECCCACGEPLEVYVLRCEEGVGIVTCLGCAAVGR